MCSLCLGSRTFVGALYLVKFSLQENALERSTPDRYGERSKQPDWQQQPGVSTWSFHAKFTYLPGMACFAVAWHVMEHAHTIRHNMFSGSFPIAHQPAQRQPV